MFCKKQNKHIKFLFGILASVVLVFMNFRKINLVPDIFLAVKDWKDEKPKPTYTNPIRLKIDLSCIEAPWIQSISEGGIIEFAGT